MWSNKAFMWAAAIYLLYISGHIWLWAVSGHPALLPNELGDSLAGIFAPVAVILLILGYRKDRNEQIEAQKQMNLAVKNAETQIANLAEMVNLQRQQLEIDKLKQQPTFLLISTVSSTASDSSGGSRVLVATVTIKNAGESAQEVVVNLRSDSAKFTTASAESPFPLGKDQSRQIQVQFQPPLPFTYILTADITYKDRFGHAHILQDVPVDCRRF